MPSLRTLGVIPARFASTRLPGKVLRELAGRPLLAWVVEAARACSQLDQVLVATDSEQVLALCDRLGFPAVMTSPELPSGTDRVYAATRQSPYDGYDLYVNIQGDEPFLRPGHMTALLKPFLDPGPEIKWRPDVTTLKVLCTPENVTNPNAVKVVTATDGRALYFSRATIPYDRDAALAPAPSASDAATQPPAPPHYWKHIGLYAFRAAALQLFPALPPSPLERTERLEQLRLLENGLSLYVEPTEFDTIGIDTEVDLRLAESMLLHR